MRIRLTIVLIAITIATTILISCNEKAESKATNAASPEDLIKRGDYLVSVMGCDDCHSPKKQGPNGPEVITELRLSGYPAARSLPEVDSNVIKNGWYTFNSDLTAAVGPWGVSYAANLTSDITGIGNWTEEQFIKAFQQGKWKGMDNSRTLLPPMPWQNFSKMTSEDVKAIFAFLKSTKPIENVTPPVQPLNQL